MYSIHARYLVCVLAPCVLAGAACRGDARYSDHLQTVRIGTFAKSRVNWLAGFLASDPLVSVSWDGRPVYRLAESVTESPDGTAFNVTLRSNVKFHNGEPVTAPRVKELLAKKMLRQQPSEIGSVDAVSERHLVIRLKRAYSLETVDLGDYAVDDESRPELRTGPFRISSFGPPAILERFRDYYQGLPALPRVEIQDYETHRAAWTAMMRGEVNFLQEVNRDAIGFIDAGGNIRAYPLLRPFTLALAFNTRHPVLRRSEVRVALTEAIDRNEVVAKAMHGHGQVADGPFWPHHWAYPREMQAPIYDPKAAALRLDAANLPVESERLGAMPARFRFTCLVVAGDTRFERIALLVQRQLFDIGVDMQFSPVSSAEELGDRVNKGAFDAFIYEMASGRTLRWPYRFWHSRIAVLPTGYSSADAALDRMKAARGDGEVKQAVADVVRIFRTDPPAVFLAFPREARAVDKSFEIPYETDRDVFGTLWKIRSAATGAERSQ